MIRSSLLLLGHGSRDPEGVEEFLSFAREFQKNSLFSPHPHPLPQGERGIRRVGGEGEGERQFEVTCAFLELSEPSIPQALESLAKNGAEKIVVLPYFLFRAGHVKKEIPEMLAEFQKSHPEIEIIYGDSLWPHQNLTRLAVQRIQQGLDSLPEPIRAETDVLVVGRGATDKEAIQQFGEAVEEVRGKISCRKLRHCFIALSEPKYADVLPEMLQDGTRHLLIFPYYLFTGILVKRIQTQALEAQKKYGAETIKVLPYFGSHPLMFEMLKEKVVAELARLSAK